MPVRYSCKDVVVFYVSESLLRQLAARSFAPGPFCLRISEARGTPGINAALNNVGLVIIDATDKPGPAVNTLEHALGRVGPNRIVVYTEHMHPGLEQFVRLRGVMLLLGPMEPEEWNALFNAPKNRLSLFAAEVSDRSDARERRGFKEYVRAPGPRGN